MDSHVPDAFLSEPGTNGVVDDTRLPALHGDSEMLVALRFVSVNELVNFGEVGAKHSYFLGYLRDKGLAETERGEEFSLKGVALALGDGVQLIAQKPHHVLIELSGGGEVDAVRRSTFLFL